MRRGYDDLARYGAALWVPQSMSHDGRLTSSLLRNPHYWAKTEHGVSRREEFGGLSLGRARRADRQTGWGISHI